MTAANLVWTVAGIGGLIAGYFALCEAIDTWLHWRAKRQQARDAEECCCTCDVPPGVEP